MIGDWVRLSDAECVTVWVAGPAGRAENGGSEQYGKCSVKDLIQSLEQLIAQAAPCACPPLLGELERLKAILWGRMLHTESAPAPQPDNGRYLTVKDVVTRFGVTDRWLYRHKKKLPHSQPSRKVLLFPEKATEKWFASRKTH